MGGLSFGGGYFGLYAIGGAVPVIPVGPGDEVTTENSYFRRMVTGNDAQFARSVTGDNADFSRAITTADAER